MARPETVPPALTEAEAADLYKPDGSPLLVFRRRVLDPADCDAAYRALRHVPFSTGNRGYASGTELTQLQDPASVGVASRTRYRRLKKDGSLSRTDNALGGYSEKTTGIAGYFDRTARYPYCRLTAFNLDHPERFAAALPFIRAVDAVFAAELPVRYAAQTAVAERTSPDFRVHGTVFTTLTVNRNWRTAAHQDAGDLREGFGVMSALCAGRFSGGLLVFPRWRVAAEMRTGDVLLADVHEWHGNTALVGVPGAYERVSCVFYYRENMRYCGTAAEELRLAKTRRPGTPLHKARPGGGPR